MEGFRTLFGTYEDRSICFCNFLIFTNVHTWYIFISLHFVFYQTNFICFCWVDKNLSSFHLRIKLKQNFCFLDSRLCTKGSFFSEGVIRFSNLQKKIFQITILDLKFKFLANNSNQQIQTSSSG